MMKNNLKKNCSKLLVFMQMASLSPVYAMDDVEDNLSNQSKIETSVVSSNELENVVESDNEVIDLNSKENGKLDSDSEDISMVEVVEDNIDLYIDEKDSYENNEGIFNNIDNYGVNNSVLNDDDNTNSVDYLSNDAVLKYLGFYNSNIGALTEQFNPNKMEYTALIKGNATTFRFGHNTISTGSSSVKMDIYFNNELIFENVTGTTDKTYTLVKGISNELRIEVSSESGNTSTYTVILEREGSYDTSLSVFRFSGHNPIIDGGFDKNKKDYVAVVKGNFTNIGFNANYGDQITSVKDPYATMDIYFNDELIFEDITKTPSKSLTLVKGKVNIMKIVVKSESGVQDIYTVTFEREGSSDTSLSVLRFSGHNPIIDGGFDKNIKDYVAVVKGNFTNIGFNANYGDQITSVKDPYATMDIYFNDELIFEDITKTPSKSLKLANDRDNIMKIIVTSENGDQVTYTVTFKREGYNDTTLSGLHFSGHRPSVDYSPGQKEYVALIEGNLTSIGFNENYSNQIISVKDPYATMDIYFNDELIFENITKTPSKTLPLVKGKANAMDIIVTAESGDKDKYTVVFERELDSNTNIKDIVINKSSLEFKDDVYIATMASWQNIFFSKLILEDFWADYKLTLNDEKEILLNEKFDLNIGENKLDIEVTSNNGTKKVYPVIFERSDNINPGVSYNISDNEWTNDDILITVNALDDSGIRYIELPNGEFVYSNEASVWVSENDIYTFKIYDNFLNETVQNIEINNIDKELPKLELKASTTELTNASVDILINVTDNVGVKYIETPGGEVITKNTLTYTVHEDGTYVFKVVDLSGNEVVKSITLNNIDSVHPTLAMELSNEDWSNEELTLNVFAMSDKGIKYIELPDGTKVEDNIAEYGISENGVYMVATESLGGNITTEKVVVSNIDTELPNLKLSSSNEKLTNNNVLINIEGIDNIGVDYIVLPNGEKVYESSYDFEVKSNGNYEFTVVDLAGNECTKSIDVNNIDKELPKVELDLSTDEITNSSVDIIINATDNVGVKYIETPDGEIVTNDNFRYAIYEDGTYVFKVVDLVGNETIKSIDVNNIDNVNPTLDIEISNNEWTNEDLTLNINALSNKGIKYIYLPDGTKVEGNYAEYTINENGTYVVVTESLGGNTTTETVNVTNIDKELPTLILKPSTEDWTNKDITISILGDDNIGVDYIVLPNGEKVYESEYSYVVEDNDEYEFEIIDLAGNSYKSNIEINNIDKEVPVVENHEEFVNVLSDVITLDISNISTLSGIYKIILPNGEEIINPAENIIRFRAAINGTYKFIIIDGAGNSLDIDVPVSTIKESIKFDDNTTDNVNNKYNDGENKNEYLNNVEDLNITNNVRVDGLKDINTLSDNGESQSNDLKYEFLDEDMKPIKSNNSIILGSIVFSTVAAIGYYIFNKKK